MKIITNLCNQCDNEQCIFQSGICRNDCDFFMPKKKNDDLISRQAARNALLNKGQHSKRYKLGETWELNLMEIEETLGELPSVEPERKPGKWLKRIYKTKELYGWYQCSQCGAIIGEPANYCSECGSYNRGAE